MIFASLVRRLAFPLAVLMLTDPALLCQTSTELHRRDQITVRLSVEKRKFVMGHPVEVTVEIANNSQETIFVAREFLQPDNSIAFVRVIVEDLTMSGPATGWAGAADSLNEPSEPSFASALAKTWIALPPGYFYGTRILIRKDDFPSGPGQYRIKARYRALDLRSNLRSNYLAKHPEEIDKLPYSSWSGEIESDPVVIEVVPPAKVGRN